MIDQSEYSDDDRDVIAQFQVRRQKQILVPILTSLVLIVLYGLFGNQWVVAVRSGNLIVAGLPVLIPIALAVFTFRNWRCPRCRRMVQRDLSPIECMLRRAFGMMWV